MERKNKAALKTAAIAVCLVFLAIFLLMSQTKPQQNEQANVSTRSGETIETENTTENCPISSTGINLCDLPLAERQKEELTEQLNRELAAKQNTTDDSAVNPQIKIINEDITPTSSVRLKVAIPGYDHADLVAENLQNMEGIADVYWSPPNLFDIEYDSSKTSVQEILSLSIFKTYNTSVVSVV